MSVDLNSCNFTGRLTADAVNKTLPTGTLLTEFSMANNTGLGDHAKTLFITVKVWGKLGQALLPYLKKAKLVGVSGELQMEQWNSKQDGTLQKKLVMDAKQVILLGSSNGNAAEPEAKDVIDEYPPEEINF